MMLPPPVLAFVEELNRLAPLLSGSIGGLLISLVINWRQWKDAQQIATDRKAENATKDAIIAKKDEDLKGLTREAIASITTLATLNQTNQEWQKRTEGHLVHIKEQVDKLADP